eukprot:1397790-Alexandrium_andersonii.AAC.1
MAMRACVCEGGAPKLFSLAAAPNGLHETAARGKYVLSQFGSLAEGSGDHEEAAECRTNDPFAMSSGMAEEEVHRVTLMQEVE